MNAYNSSNYDENLQAYIRPIKIFTASQNEPRRVLRIPPENIDPKEDKSNLWDAISERESLSKLTELAVEFRQENLQADVVAIGMDKAKRVLIQSRREEHLILFPQLLLKEKLSRRVAQLPGPENEIRQNKAAESIFMHDFQEWKFSKTGFVYSAFFPKICLTLLTTVPVQLEIHLKARRRRDGAASNGVVGSEFDSQETSNSKVVFKKGYLVGLGTRQLNENNDYRDQDQQWCFSKHANVYSKVIISIRFSFAKKKFTNSKNLR